MTARDWLAVAVVLVVLLGGLPVIRAVTRRAGASPEVARKSVHVAMGLVCMAFPWVFEGAVAVWVLAAIATLPLVLLRVLPKLRAGLGSALHGVDRPSFGEVLFAPAVAAVFQMSGGDPFLFCIPGAVLTLADAAGALGGTRWGRHRYGAGEGFKSIEGSMMFFLTAFACVMLPLWLGGRVGFPHAALIGLILGLLAMMAEGLADRGFDNLVIPVGCFFVLNRMLDLETAPLVWRLVAAVFFLGAVLTGSRWSTLSGGALLGCALLGYGCAVLADPRFMLPPLAVFVSHVMVTRRHRLTGSFDHRLDAVLAHAIGCLPWVLLVERGVITSGAGLAGVSFAMASQLAMMTTATHWWIKEYPAGLVYSVSKGWICAAMPGLAWLWPVGWGLVLPVGLALAASVVVLAWFRHMRPHPSQHPTKIWLMEGSVSLLSSLPALLLVA